MLIVCSQVPLSIIVVGLCDKLGESMQRLCEKLPERSWDNFRFIQFPAAHEPKTEAALTSFAAQTLSGIPNQMKVGGESQLQMHVLILQNPCHWHVYSCAAFATAAGFGHQRREPRHGLPCTSCRMNKAVMIQPAFAHAVFSHKYAPLYLTAHTDGLQARPGGLRRCDRHQRAQPATAHHSAGGHGERKPAG